MITSQKIAELLNELLRIDPMAAYFLTTQFCPASDMVADHRSIVVHQPRPVDGSGWIMTFLGFMQGISEMDGHKLAACYDDKTGRLMGFTAIREEDWKPAQPVVSE